MQFYSKLREIREHNHDATIFRIMAYEIFPLHKHKHLTDACSEILNKEWPRSLAARYEHFLVDTDLLLLSIIKYYTVSLADIDFIPVSSF